MIDKEIEEMRKETARERPKVLLLGPADSGKSTFLKQLRLLYGNGFTPDEQNQARRVIHKSIINAMKTLVALIDHGQILPDAQTMADFEGIRSYEHFSDDFVPDDVIKYVKNAWGSKEIRELVKNPKLPVHDSAFCFLKQLEVVLRRDYVPSNEDILKVRQQTESVTEWTFNIHLTPYVFYDVAGEFRKRKHWAPYFDTVNAIIFLVDISSYDLNLEEDPTVNRIKDALDCFEKTVNLTILENLGLVVFFNKKDLLKDKLKNSPFAPYFPEFQGTESYEAVVKFVSQLFMKSIKNPKGNRQISQFVTCCVDTKAMDAVITTVS